MINQTVKRKILDAMLRDIDSIDRGIIEKIITAKNRIEDLLNNADSLDSLVLSNMTFAPYVYQIKIDQHMETENTISMLLDMGWSSPLIRPTPHEEIDHDNDD
jgi:hypothetical protein